jgi:hypothetical protein
MFSRIGLDGIQILNFSLVDQVPDNCVVHVQVSHDFTSSNQLSEGVVADSDVGVVGAQGNGSQKPILGERILQQFVRKLDSCKSRN